VKRYAALLRGIMPTNAKMADLRTSFEKAGFAGVRTVIASGNVVFDAPAKPIATLERRIEAALEQHNGRTFTTFVRSLETLEELLASDPWKGFRIPGKAKRVVTFLRQPPQGKITLPRVLGAARIVRITGNEAFTYYVPGDTSPTFMKLLEDTLGSVQTSRMWGTLEKIVRA
jgi:uncharacterized protein (DUF1697 family)